MTSAWTVDQLDPKKLFEVVPNADPETSARFSLPVPNWLGEDGAPRFKHKSLRLIDKGDRREWRFMFWNYEDNCEQGVKIDGTGVVMFTGPTPGQGDKIKEYVSSLVPDVKGLLPQHLQKVLDHTYKKMGLVDRYNDNIETLNRKMKPGAGVEGNYGPYVYDEEKLPVSATIFLPGSGTFQGPALEPQQFENGSFITFPGMNIKTATTYIKSYDPFDPPTMKARLVSKAAFLKSRKDKGGDTINMNDIPQQREPVRNYKKIRPIGGFPELAPAFVSVQQNWIRSISEVFTSYGFSAIETRMIEDLSTLLEQGEDADKEIFEVTRRSSQHDSSKDRPLALRFDLTVPTARYIAQNESSLTFPFRRQQIGPVFRADDPNQGRYRQFYQCDVDVIGIGTGINSVYYDAEMPRIMYDVTQAVGIEGVEIGINNRKIYQGFFEGNGLEGDEIVSSIRILDKLHKIGPEGVASRLSDELDLAATIIDKSLELASIKTQDLSFADRVMALGVDNQLIRDGVEELSIVMKSLEDLPRGFAVANLSIARGLDYYSGTVYEGQMRQYPDFPAILAGGRYDNLVSRFMPRKLPGVGISFGLTRVFNFLADKKVIMPGRSTPTQVLIAHDGKDEDIRIASQLRDELRKRGVAAELFYGDLYEQMNYANRKKIPHVLFRTDNPEQPFEIKNMATGSQSVVNFQTWTPQV